MKILKLFKEEDHRKALYASLVFIMLMILFFLLVSLEEPDPLPVEEIIEIEMPDVEIEQGSSPGGSSPSEKVAETEEIVSEPTKEIEQQEEVSVKVNSGKSEKGNNNTKVDKPVVDKPVVNSEFEFKSDGKTEGKTDGEDFGKDDGVKGGGKGDLEGEGTYNPNRKLTVRPTIDANVQEEGTVALDIWVNAEGKVEKTRLKESESSTGSAYLIKLAEKAARTMRYDRKSGAGLEHVGYQRFVFTKS